MSSDVYQLATGLSGSCNVQPSYSPTLLYRTHQSTAANAARQLSSHQMNHRIPPSAAAPPKTTRMCKPRRPHNPRNCLDAHKANLWIRIGSEEEKRWRCICKTETYNSLAKSTTLRDSFDSYVTTKQCIDSSRYRFFARKQLEHATRLPLKNS